ncbi:hypothetical protein PsorP6_013918 [Peronosclerospora sorghi]|uniref:Uncharacterized protein n=1 Tax=Peronosclerospora sorghi TaxID=230839 RepID=A0ACC0VGY6_9STRA|nr:hypothetical protein PsorP6_013918 [Peronosclerospora sorghi]
MHGGVSLNFYFSELWDYHNVEEQHSTPMIKINIFFGSFYAAMASSLLGDEYASTSPSDNEENTKVTRTYIKEFSAVSTTSSISQLLPSADELLSNDTNSVVSTSDAIAYVPTNKRKKKQQISNQSTKVPKSETGEAVRRWKN